MLIHQPENASIACEYNSLTLLRIPARSDNYLYLLHSEATGETAAIDPSDAAPIQMQLHRQNWQLTHIFNTHHHGDHTGGNRALRAETNCEILGFEPDAERIPGITRKLTEGEHFRWGDTDWQVLFLPGHTLGHIAYYLPQPRWLFCGDVLFLMGCGRLFEGTPEQAYHSLQQIKQLPDDTLIFCAHEYTQTNGEFALSVDPDNAALRERMAQVRALRAEGTPTVPAPLREEKATNPFLRAASLEEFASLRKLRDGW